MGAVELFTVQADNPRIVIRLQRTPISEARHSMISRSLACELSYPSPMGYP
jgi:hypothetical protein